MAEIHNHVHPLTVKDKETVKDTQKTCFLLCLFNTQFSATVRSHSGTDQLQLQDDRG